MFNKIKEQVDKELKKFIRDTDKFYSLSKISMPLFNNIKDFVLRDGKRIRPVIFIMSYRGYAKRSAPNLYTCALAMELLHDFFLVHDDIIDKSQTRRGKPSMHKMFDNYLENHKDVKFNGQDLAIVAGDVIFSMAMQAFISIKEEARRKEKALTKFTEAAFYTGTGEFIELTYGIDIEKISKEDIFKIYDYKTAYYTFCYPLITGAILGGAGRIQIDRLLQYGVCLGRAFQIKDDILSMFSEEEKIGKPLLSDLKEAKKTVLIWYAYHKTNRKNKETIKRIFSSSDVDNCDLFKMREIVVGSGALEYAEKEISRLIKNAKRLNEALGMKRLYKEHLDIYIDELMGV